MEQPVIMLMGPTASGKTGLALAMARHFDIEIISVDSALVYRDMDIGTAKPDAAEQSVCPHHLIDIITPMEAYSAASFHDDAHRLIGEIHGRGRIPVLAGGTMLYYKALFEGLSALPQADPVLRAAIDADALRDGWPAQHARLALLDPDTAARLAPNDAQRIQRALEVCLLTGKTMSALWQEGRAGTPALNALRIGLVPAERRWLHDRIALRFGQMLDNGFLDEVRQLRSTWPALTPDLPSMRCVGYRQALQHLDGLTDRDTFVAQGVAATRQLAKRQLTWMRSLDVVPVDAQAPDVTDKVLAATDGWLQTGRIAPGLPFDGDW